MTGNSNRQIQSTVGPTAIRWSYAFLVFYRNTVNPKTISIYE